MEVSPAHVPNPFDSAGDITHLVIGRVLGARGVAGELRVQVLTDFPERFAHLKTVLVGDELVPFTVQSARLHRGVLLLKLKECVTTNEAQRLRGKLLRVPIEEAVALPEGQYYWHEIIGLEVWTTQGQLVGTVGDIIQTGSADVYVVLADKREVLIPAIEDVIKEIDLARRRIVIEPMPGLL